MSVSRFSNTLPRPVSYEAEKIISQLETDPASAQLARFAHLNPIEVDLALTEAARQMNTWGCRGIAAVAAGALYLIGADFANSYASSGTLSYSSPVGVALLIIAGKAFFDLQTVNADMEPKKLGIVKAILGEKLEEQRSAKRIELTNIISAEVDRVRVSIRTATAAFIKASAELEKHQSLDQPKALDDRLAARTAEVKYLDKRTLCVVDLGKKIQEGRAALQELRTNHVDPYFADKLVDQQNMQKMNSIIMEIAVLPIIPSDATEFDMLNIYVRLESCINGWRLNSAPLHST